MAAAIGCGGSPNGGDAAGDAGDGVDLAGALEATVEREGASIEWGWFEIVRVAATW